ncbi:restriction endonuclease [uncultured Roseobacter sp.]|uniref:nSTAND3 domain-containing NTPase n=1 Tax=uncultured Roseobacter sp. TaxID=114847 RepID=UPI002610BE2E|nr:restriction endonuclease [uncultured Roseobacter sp.]
MQNYNFDNLNDKEFEVLVNDLISSKESVHVDRFKPGKDAGVDGRFFSAKEHEVIVQSKHWIKSGIAALMRRLAKDEAHKVKLINPKRYIFATSLPLSRADKIKLKDIFSPYITSEDDILGKDNLNDLLAQYPDVEKKHYKLWLSSSSVLDAMLNSALTGRREAKRDQIIDATKMYVVTENHSNAIDKLEELHSVVITGEGGIGKTTLADQLAHYYVGKGFELCVIEDDLSEAEAGLKKGRQQVFYFDDFLGRNYLMAIEGRTDSRVLNFMDRIEIDRSKRFILTSRSSVLKQGKFDSDLLGIKKVDKKEYEITISSLSILDRARILYNHIWNSGLSNEHIEQLYIDRRYATITQHDNFNPRLISFITDPDRVRDVSIEDYRAYVVEKLDNPEDVWAHVFDKQIDEVTRIAVFLVVYNGTAVSESELRSAFKHRVLNDGLATASNVVFQFDSMMKVAVGSLLQREISSTSKGPQINLFNPSVADFVLRRHNRDSATLGAFFVCLNTENSLVNLKSLKESSRLSKELYYRILSTLCAEKINKGFSQEHPKYFTRLLQMISD